MSEKKEELIVVCPHCNIPVIILELNCKIFRHAILKTTNQQIDPHANKEICDNYVKNNQIYGCGKPFKIIQKDEDLIPEICDYI